MNISGDPPKFFGGPPFGGPPQKYGGPLLFWGPRGPSKNSKTKRKPRGAPKKITYGLRGRELPQCVDPLSSWSSTLIRYQRSDTEGSTLVKLIVDT